MTSEEYCKGEINKIEIPYYASKNRIVKLIEKYCNRNDLLVVLDELNKTIEELEIKQKNCKSDYSYWSFEGDIEDMKTFKNVYMSFIFEELNKYKCQEILDLKRDSKYLCKVKERKIKIIEDLEKYKPRYFRETIKILKEVLEDE